MQYSREVEEMFCVAKGAKHDPAPIPEEGKWVKAKEITDIFGLTHGVGWCAPQQGACKLTLNVKNGVIEEALVETLGCSGMTHSAAMAAEIPPGKTILEALNSDLVCDAINTAMRELFLQIVYGRTQSAFSDDGLTIGAGLEDLGKGLRSGEEFVPAAGLFDYEGGETGQVAVSDCIVRMEGLTAPLYGFVNQTVSISYAARPNLFEVLCGKTGQDGTEGMTLKNCFATSLLGPILAKNPDFCRLLLQRLLGEDFEEYDDSLAREAYRRTLNEFSVQGGSGKSS